MANQKQRHPSVLLPMSDRERYGWRPKDLALLGLNRP